MALTGVIINKEDTGRQDPVADFARTAALLLYLPDLGDLDVAYNEKYRLIQLSDAEDLGINASYDANNDVLAFYHIEEFFRVAPEGILIIIPVDRLALGSVLSQVNISDITPLRVIGVSDYNYDLQYDIPTAQAWVDGYRNNMHYVSSFMINGYDEYNTVDPRTMACPNISICIAKDPYVDTLIADPGYALPAIGTVLGGLCVRQVSENLGSVDINRKPDNFKGQRDYPLTDKVRGRWLDAKLTSAEVPSVNDLSFDDAKALTDKGYIYVDRYTGYGGYFFNSSPTATIIESDYAYIERNATWDKAAILVRNALMPEIKSKLPKRNGKIIPTKIQELKNLALDSLQEMFTSDELDEATIFIDANQTVSETVPLEVSMKVAVGDILHEIKIALAVVNQI